MSSWKKYFKLANTSGTIGPISGRNVRPPHTGSADFGRRNYASQLPEVYHGHPNRVERYNQYESMDMDSEINACLDIIAEFSTQLNESNGTPFDIKFKEQPTDNEVEIIKKQLQQWCKLNQLNSRMFKLFRNTIKYGDQVFVRDPETFQMMWVDMTKVSRVIVNENRGKEPEQYAIRDINPNFQNLTVASKTTSDFQISPVGSPIQQQYTVPNNAGAITGSRFSVALNETVIDAKHVVHISLNEGLDHLWPFGQSILENIFKIFKQKELLEDAILIYRVQRAPERRVFYIDVGNMPPHMAMSFVDRIKNEMHQRRIPTLNGGSGSPIDAAYSPLSINEDFYFPTTSEGRGSKVETLPGGDNLGSIDDLRYFSNKLARGLRVPSSYLPTGPDEQTGAHTDGRVGTALIQEYRFNQYCERLQSLVASKLDDEFKMFLRWRGFNIDSGLFDITLTPPQNFATYRQAEVDQVRVNVFQSIEGLPYLSKRFSLERFLGLTKEEIMQNEKMWREERDSEEAGAGAPEGTDLRAVGVMPRDMNSDMELGDEFASMEPEETLALPPEGEAEENV
jgi:hypothetical protein